jgi:hypothetical protein
MNNIPNPREGRPMKSRGKNEDELVEFEVNVGKDTSKKNHKNLEKLVEADKLYPKHHPSPDDAMELQEDKTKLRLINYIDTKWFNPDNLQERKIKLLKNRVIKKINSGEFLHKKEVNKYIKDYYAKNSK